LAESSVSWRRPLIL